MAAFLGATRFRHCNARLSLSGLRHIDGYFYRTDRGPCSDSATVGGARRWFQCLMRLLPGDSPVLFVGPPVARGLSIAETLAETLPVLPTKPVAEGTTWTTQQPVHSLEGWSWGTGVLSGSHRVTSVRHRGGRRLVTVESTAGAELQPIEETGFTGTLERTFNWTFDATSGRLVSLSMTPYR